MLQQQVQGCAPLEDADLCIQCLVARMQGFADAHQVLCPGFSDRPQTGPLVTLLMQGDAKAWKRF